MVIEWLGGLRGERDGLKMYRMAIAPLITKSRRAKTTALNMSLLSALSADRKKSGVTRRIFRRDIILVRVAGINLSQ